jgi:hypothetical protein
MQHESSAAGGIQLTCHPNNLNNPIHLLRATACPKSRVCHWSQVSLNDHRLPPNGDPMAQGGHISPVMSAPVGECPAA